jgi:hypothetical protein
MNTLSHLLAVFASKLQIILFYLMSLTGSTFDPFYAVFEATPSGATVKCKRLIQKKITEQQVKNSKN